VTNGNQVNFPGNLRVVTDVDSNYTTNTWVDTTTTADNNGHVSSVIARTYENFPWGQQLIQEVDDPNGKAYTTTYAYNNGSPTEGGYGQLASITYPDGNWVGYSYYNSTNDTLANGTPIAQFGALQTEYHPWLSTVTNPANANASNSRAITYTYAQDFDGQYTLEASRVETINGTTVANRVTTNHLNLTANNLELWERSVADSTGSGQTLTTVSKVYSPYQAANFSVYAGEPYSTQHPDGTMESYAVFSGTYTAASQTLSTTPPGFDLEQIVIHGVTPAVGAGVSGAQPVSSLTDSGSDHTSSTIDQIYVIPNQSTETITYRQGGLVKLQLNYVYTAGGFAFVSSTASTYTPSCKLASTALSNGATSTSAYPQEFKTQDVDATGVTTNYTLDAMQRIVSASRAPGAGYPGTGITLPTSPIVTSYTYDSDNNVTQTQVAGPATALPFSASVTLTTSSTYNPAGKLTSQTDANGLTTFYADSPGNLTQTTTYPGGATKVVTKNLDETPISITGTAQVPTYYAYTLASSGFLSVQENLGSSTSHNWSVVQTDWLGRKVTVQSPNPTVANPTPTSGSVTTAYTYDSLGQLTEISTPGLAATLYSYTPMGALEMTAVDVNGNGTIDLAGTDRITQTDTAYYEDTNGVWWLKTTQGIYATPGQSFETIVKTTAVQLSGLSSGTAVTTTKDADKNLTTQTTTVSGNVVKTLTASSGLTATAVQYTCNGLPVSQTSVNGNTTTFGYDGVGRQIQVVDPRKGPVDTIYYANSNQVYYTQYDSGSILIQKYTYSSGGLVASQTDEGGNTKDFTYDTMGDVLTNYGTGTTNVTYVYDSFGRMSSQTTWTGTGNVPGVVTFTYNGDLPLLSGKEDALLATVTHSYDSLGRELTRTDSRGVVKTNSYDSATGDLLGCVYTNDPQSTPALAYTYGRTGQLSTVTDGAGERTFTYNYNLSYNTGDLQMASEALPSCFGSSGSTTRNIIYAYAPPAGESYGLLTGVSLSNSSITSNDQSTSYGYDPAGGRLMSVTANGAGFSAYTFAYSYTPNSELLIGSVANSATNFTQSYTYDPYRDLVTGATAMYNGATDTNFTYSYNALNQRQTATQSGNVYLDSGGTTNVSYTYDGLGEVTSAVATLGGTTMPGRVYSYAYDNAGNRLSEDHTGVQSLVDSYTPNKADQIGSKESTTVAVQGNAAAAANVVVQTTLANRAGNYWAFEALLNNASGPAYGSIPVYAGQAGAGSGGKDLVSQINIMAFLLPLSETITYDADGDMLTDGQWIYTWDAEHRLIQMVTNTTAQGTGLAATQVNFAYDYLGRRYKKTVTVNGGTPTVSQYVYFGWNAAAELDGSGNLKRHFIWGLDRSSTTSGLGGIGGLLMIQDSGHTYLPAYDGGANVAALLDASSSGAYAAVYEYSPYGELQRKQGSYAVSNPFRFSTKWWDEETGLSYYGMRYYNSSLGRFISRDPIEEKGGINLYAFCGNGPTNGFDLLGMQAATGSADSDNNEMSPQGLDSIGALNNSLSCISNMYNGEGSGDWVSNWFNPANFDAPALPDATNAVSATASDVADIAAQVNSLQISVPSGDPTDDNATVNLSGVSTPTLNSSDSGVSIDWSADFNAGNSLSMGSTDATNVNDPTSFNAPAPNNFAQAAATTDGVGSAPAGYVAQQSWTVANGGTNAVLYLNPTTGATILAYQGTRTDSLGYFFSDLGTDILNAFGGQSSRYTFAVSIAQSVQDQYPDTVLTGLSLGGGEAALASVQTGLTAVTFNAAGVNPANYHITGSTSQITNYSVATDGLTLLQTVTPLPSALGNQVTLSPGNAWYAVNPIAAHGSSSILSSLGIY
jgi:RHS repeat-associated protein